MIYISRLFHQVCVDNVIFARLNGNSPVVTALEEKENYDHNSAQHTEDFPPTGKQSKRSISRFKEIESPMPGVALKSLAPGVTNEVLERARVIVEKAVKQNKVGLHLVILSRGL